jgi:hypothetical protein
VSADGIPDDVHAFLTACIDSVEQLELLLLLRQAPEIDWTPDAARSIIYGHIESVRHRLRQLQKHGLLIQTGSTDLRYRFAPADERLRSTVDQLAAIYKERRVAVITFIASQPLAHVRTISDAFRFRRGED